LGRLLRRLLGEPLVHFIGIGLLLFLLYAQIGPAGSARDRIVISSAMVAEIAAGHERLWGRPPTAAELERLIIARTDEEILYREGLALGLDRDDSVIKRRVRQKYELIAEEIDGREPTEAELAAYLQANPERFRAPPILSFTQVLVPGNGSAAATAAGAAQLLTALQSGADPASVGRTTLLPGRVDDRPLDLVAREFGEGFAAALAELPTGQWQGPLASGYGLHLVKIERHVAAALPALEQARHAVLREWQNEQRRQARSARLADLRERYAVEIEGAE
jgi:hypothetical protein